MSTMQFCNTLAVIILQREKQDNANENCEINTVGLIWRRKFEAEADRISIYPKNTVIMVFKIIQYTLLKQKMLNTTNLRIMFFAVLTC